MRGALRIACIVMSLTAAAQLARSQGPQPSGKIIPGSGDSRLDDSVRSVSSQLRCPVCQGESIQESPAELAKEMRNVVREQLAAGRSSDEVKAYFVSKYGEWILLKPEAHGANLAVYLLPLALLVGGAVLIIVAVRRWIRPRSEGKAGSP